LELSAMSARDCNEFDPRATNSFSLQRIHPVLPNALQSSSGLERRRGESRRTARSLGRGRPHLTGSSGSPRPTPRCDGHQACQSQPRWLGYSGANENTKPLKKKVRSPLSSRQRCNPAWPSRCLKTLDHLLFSSKTSLASAWKRRSH
jgi:hypothetical protein